MCTHEYKVSDAYFVAQPGLNILKSNECCISDIGRKTLKKFKHDTILSQIHSKTLMIIFPLFHDVCSKLCFFRLVFKNS